MDQQISDLSGQGPVAMYSARDTPVVTNFSRDRLPPGTKGVFYYHLPPALPPVAGELRFRLCNSVSQFADGKDLEVGLSKPWHRTLHTIVQGARYTGIRDLLLEEGLVDQALVADVEKLPRDRQHDQVISLYDIDQPFVAKLDATRPVIRLVTRKSLQAISLPLFNVGRVSVNPYQGTHFLLSNK